MTSWMTLDGWLDRGKGKSDGRRLGCNREVAILALLEGDFLGMSSNEGGPVCCSCLHSSCIAGPGPS
jgi:hypothetical protein